MLGLVVGGGAEFVAEGGVAGKGFFDDVEGGVGRADVFNLDLFAFELLVVLEKTAKDEEAVRRKIARFDVIAELGVARGHGDDFVVAGAGVDHGHDPDGAGFDERERLDRLLAKNEDVEGIVVFGISLRNEAVVRRIKNGGVDDAVHFEETGLFVELVFDVRTERNFDDGLEVARDFGSGRNVVPCVEQGAFLGRGFEQTLSQKRERRGQRRTAIRSGAIAALTSNLSVSIVRRFAA